MEKFNHCKPAAELYIGGRVNWLCPVEGAAQLVGMLPLASLKLDDWTYEVRISFHTITLEENARLSGLWYISYFLGDYIW
jgi:hypothetical protein